MWSAGMRLSTLGCLAAVACESLAVVAVDFAFVALLAADFGAADFGAADFGADDWATADAAAAALDVDVLDC